MKISESKGKIVITCLSNDEYQIVSAWGLTIWDRARKAIIGPVSEDLLARLNRICTLPLDIAAMLSELRRRRQLIDSLRAEPEPKPLTDFPVKATLYEHQIRGANLALVSLGLIDGIEDA
ncbi:MAG: hypothetical protein Q4C04_04315 [Clostridia bacterium]|nr:hypothetical protein [Clostridia bacterium]